jgi:hypothetical protein
MPEVNGKTFLICRGFKNQEDQLVNTARRVQYGDREPYIRYCGHIGGSEFGWRVLEEAEYENTVWQEINLPGISH